MYLFRMRPLLILCLLIFMTVDAGFFDSLIGKITGSSSSSSSSSSSNLKRKPVSNEKAKKYLQDFGYVSASNSLNAAPNGMSGDLSDAGAFLKNALRKFQRFAHLKETGELDNETKEKMAEPRCGVTDVLAVTRGGAAFKWRKNDLTYSIESFSSDLPRDDVRRALKEGYEVWSAVTPLTFREVPSGSNADIKVRFGTRNHNDPWPFDGEGGVLAHATMPENGVLHFDDDEDWVYKDAKKLESGYVDLLAVAIHEGGHTLGLSHSRDEDSIMAPFYQKTTDNRGHYKQPTLKTDDIRSIQDIYGAGSGRSSSSSGVDIGRGSFTTPRPVPTTTTKSFFGRFFGGFGDKTTTTTRRPLTNPSGGSGSSFGGSSGSHGGGSTSGCPRYVDAYTPSDDFSYLFSGSTVYRISGTRVYKSYPISEMFPGVPTPVMGAVFNPTNGNMLLFANKQVYIYRYSRLSSKFRQETDSPKRLPSDVSFTIGGALRWINGHQIIISTADNFVVYDEFWNRVTMSNRVSSYFPNLPEGVKGIESPSGSTVTAFTSSSVVRYNSRTRTIEQQKSLREYITC